MLASLLRPKARRQQIDHTPFAFSSPLAPSDSSPWYRAAHRQGAPPARRTGDSEDEQREEIDEDMGQDWSGDEDEDEEDHEDDGPLESSPLLPIFSASHLDALPVYDLTLAIRPLIASRCETTLTWDQLRSPQVSQFLVKPIQQKLMSAHFSRATLYALMANCLQFEKEIHLNPGNSGASQTRAMVSELLAIKLLREYTTRELIDALSYEFYPLQGQDPATAWASGLEGKRLAGTGRVSCLEVAIRAQAKRFLAHPVVVKQLEAIWAGTIVFHSAADHLHRRAHQTAPRGAMGYGTSPDYQGDRTPSAGNATFRRSVTLYNPRDASLFKLSRLRVPRYRQFLSTLSFAVLLGLFLAVLEQRSRQITSLEVVFWFWSAGFMLDEIVGFNEQGFSLYLMSFWNLFDLGILLLLVCYYCLRIYGTFLTYPRNRLVANQAYDVLAANAVLLFPRLFSILDHYRYFSQLLIAFRIMASDLIAVFVLIVIACSGFFVAFLSFGSDNSPNTVAYALFQMLMGFTPTAWAMWEEYNSLGRSILTIFLFICHFVVVTILITVLTNSFMRIVQNANEEHQFLFAVNTISMVKSDALFSYVAPTNIIAWLVTPFRYLMPFRQFIRLNRTIIKITHLPVLFTICFYEKMILSSRVIEPMDLVEAASRTETPGQAEHWRPGRLRAFSNRARLVREPSIATNRKDQALEEVFRRPFSDKRLRERPSSIQDRQKSTVIKDWMREIGSGPAPTPDEQDSATGDLLEIPVRRMRFPLRKSPAARGRDFTETTRSVASNPEDRTSRLASPIFHRDGQDSVSHSRTRQPSHHTDMEGDDELTSEDDHDSHGKQSHKGSESDDELSPIGNNSEKTTPKFYSSRPSTARVLSRRASPTRRPKHNRTVSGATMLYNPIGSPNLGAEGQTAPPTENHDSSEGEDRLPFISTSVDQGTMNRAALARNLSLNPMSVPEIDGLYLSNRPLSKRRQRSLLFDLGSDLGDNKAVAGAFGGAVPSSFNTQLAFATGGLRRDGPSQAQTQDMLSKLVLARMNNIEEGFREVIKEVKDLRLAGSSRSRSHSRSRPKEMRPLTAREKKKAPEKKDLKKRRPSSAENPWGQDQRSRQPAKESHSSQ
ncbi:Calcium channel YVC1 [Penicillium rolfsii]|nr:Calcium channel YVC1 [Penicillium rolfsii]